MSRTVLTDILLAMLLLFGVSARLALQSSFVVIIPITLATAGIRMGAASTMITSSTWWERSRQCCISTENQ